MEIQDETKRNIQFREIQDETKRNIQLRGFCNFLSKQDFKVLFQLVLTPSLQNHLQNINFLNAFLIFPLDQSLKISKLYNLP